MPRSAPPKRPSTGAVIRGATSIGAGPPRERRPPASRRSRRRPPCRRSGRLLRRNERRPPKQKPTRERTLDPTAAADGRRAGRDVGLEAGPRAALACAARVEVRVPARRAGGPAVVVDAPARPRRARRSAAPAPRSTRRGHARRGARACRRRWARRRGHGRRQDGCRPRPRGSRSRCSTAAPAIGGDGGTAVVVEAHRDGHLRRAVTIAACARLGSTRRRRHGPRSPPGRSPHPDLVRLPGERGRPRPTGGAARA